MLLQKYIFQIHPCSLVSLLPILMIRTKIAAFIPDVTIFTTELIEATTCVSYCTYGYWITNEAFYIRKKIHVVCYSRRTEPLWVNRATFCLNLK